MPLETQSIEQGRHGGDVARVASQLQCNPSDIVDFSANINPRGLPASAVSILAHAANNPAALLRYPDWSSHPLRHTLAAQLGVPQESIVLGAGASALITDIVRALKPSLCVAFVPAFAEYRRACASCGVQFHGVPLTAEDHFRLDAIKCRAVLEALHPQLLILNNPHNPSGALISQGELRAIVEDAANAGTAVLLDEAFIDYAPESQLTQHAAASPALIAVRSLTKFYGCPGLRIGYAVAHASMARHIEQVIPEWPIGTLALDTLHAAVQDKEYAEATLAENARDRTLLASHLSRLGLQTFHSAANFLFLKLPHDWPDSSQVREQLLRQHRILVRDCRSFEGLEDRRYLRVAVLRPNQNHLLAQALAFLGEGLK